VSVETDLGALLAIVRRLEQQNAEILRVLRAGPAKGGGDGKQARLKPDGRRKRQKADGTWEVWGEGTGWGPYFGEGEPP